MLRAVTLASRHRAHRSEGIPILFYLGHAGTMLVSFTDFIQKTVILYITLGSPMTALSPGSLFPAGAAGDLICRAMARSG